MCIYTGTGQEENAFKICLFSFERQSKIECRVSHVFLSITLHEERAMQHATGTNTNTIQNCVLHLQGSAKEWSLGCVIPASWPPLAAGARFTQPRDHSLAGPCIRIP